MHVVPRSHPYLQKYIELTLAMGMENFGHLVDHYHYSEIDNRPVRADNQMFLLAPAKASVLERIDPRLACDKRTAALIEELRLLAMEAFPQQISNFRLVHCQENESSVFAYN